ncbi:MAG: HIT family protein [Nitrososphaera sp.]|jgi:histidine triad (HIT) family protein
MDCIFCKIVSGNMPARKIEETQKSLAFLDAFPLTKGHTLVIPKTHYAKIQEMTKEDSSDLFELAKTITNKLESLFPASLIAIHNGKESGQEVPHVHIHLIPRNSSDKAGPVHSLFSSRPKFTDIELDEIVNTLRNTK